MLSVAFLLFAVVHLAIWVWGWKAWAQYGRPRGLFLVLFGGTLLWYDNFRIGIGRFIGESGLLEAMTVPAFAWHWTMLPLLVIAAGSMAKSAGLKWAQPKWVIGSFCVVASVLIAMGDGAFLGEYFDGTRRYNVVLRAENWYSPEELGSIPVATATGGVQALGELVRVTRTAGPSSIRRIDRKRTLTLQVTPPPHMPMEEALTIIQERVAPAILDSMPEDGTVKYRGTAEALDEALTSMTGSFILAVVILYLLISALFRSFRDSLLVILTIPMATVGGIVALRLVDLALFASGGQAMDLLTMIGFVILLGLVVNNAILLVYRARDAEREGMGRREAVESAIRLRLRPILMSTTTSVFGMLPLLLMPGAGTELYRGMAAVIVGGMLVSTLFTLILLPSLLRMNEERNTLDGTVPEAV